MVHAPTRTTDAETAVGHELLQTQLLPEGYVSAAKETGMEPTTAPIATLFRMLTGPDFETLRRVPVRDARQLALLRKILLSQEGSAYVRSMGSIKIVADTPELKAAVRDLLTLVKGMEGSRARVMKLIGFSGTHEIREQANGEFGVVDVVKPFPKTAEIAEAVIDRHIDEVEADLLEGRATTVKLGQGAVTALHIKRLMILKAEHGALLEFDESLQKTLRILHGVEPDPESVHWAHMRFGKVERQTMLAMLRTIGVIETMPDDRVFNAATAAMVIDKLKPVPSPVPKPPRFPATETVAHAADATTPAVPAAKPAPARKGLWGTLKGWFSRRAEPSLAA